MSAWQQWLALQNYAAGAQKDFPQKVQLLRLFLTQRGHIDGAERVELAAIDAATLGDYQAFVFDYVSPKTGRKLKTMSQIHALSYVQSFFRFLKTTKRIALDPARVIRLPHAPQTLPAALLTPEEMRRLLAVPDVHTPTGFRDRCILEVFWCTGMRIGELLSLAVGDLEFAQALCTIRHGKGGKPRVVPLGAGTALGRVALFGCVASVTRRGNLQDFADRLDSVGAAMLVNEVPQDLSRRSSSAWAKNALASFRISLARRNSLTSRSSALMRSRSSLVMPSR